MELSTYLKDGRQELFLVTAVGERLRNKEAYAFIKPLYLDLSDADKQVVLTWLGSPRRATLSEVRNVADVMAEDAPTVTNDRGGKQSELAAAFELLPPDAICTVAAVLHKGSLKYGRYNWKFIPRGEHLRHALGHIFCYLSKGSVQDLAHAATRLLMALETREAEAEE